MSPQRSLLCALKCQQKIITRPQKQLKSSKKKTADAESDFRNCHRQMSSSAIYDRTELTDGEQHLNGERVEARESSVDFDQWRARKERRSVTVGLGRGALILEETGSFFVLEEVIDKKGCADGLCPKFLSVSGQLVFIASKVLYVTC